MPHGLNIYSTTLLEEVMEHAKGILSPEDFEKLHAAF